MASIAALDEDRPQILLDYPCDLKPGEKVVFILNIHGAGSIGNWQRHYFPAMDYKEKYRLVVATPTAATGRAACACWVGEADDAHLQNIADLVFETVRQAEHQVLLAGRPQPGRHDLQPHRLHRLLQGQGGRLAQPVRRPHRPAGPRPRLRPAAGHPATAAAGPSGARPRRHADLRHQLHLHHRQHEIVSLPEHLALGGTSSGAGARERRPTSSTQGRPHLRLRAGRLSRAGA